MIQFENKMYEFAINFPSFMKVGKLNNKLFNRTCLIQEYRHQGTQKNLNVWHKYNSEVLRICNLNILQVSMFVNHKISTK